MATTCNFGNRILKEDCVMSPEGDFDVVAPGFGRLGHLATAAELGVGQKFSVMRREGESRFLGSVS